MREVGLSLQVAAVPAALTGDRRDGDGGAALLAAAGAGAAHWRGVCAEALDAFARGGEEAVEALSLAERVVL